MPIKEVSPQLAEEAYRGRVQLYLATAGPTVLNSAAVFLNMGSHGL